MSPNRRKYWILSLLSLGAYGWIGFQLVDRHDTVGLCLLKATTGLPCPSCGTTRSVLLLLQGCIQEGILLNPLGLIAIALLLIIPIWILTDIFLQKQSLIYVYTRAEKKIKGHRSVYLPLIVLIVLNWVWNIAKGI